MGLAISSIEYVLGDRVVTNDNLLAEHPDWDMKAISVKTGITRRYCSSSATGLELGHEAARKAIGDAGTAEIDALLAVTSTTEYAFPGVACLLQHRLGLGTGIFSYDINLGCSGFTYAWITLSALASAGVVRRPLLVCTDTYTRFIAPDDRSARPIFSDAAAAIRFEVSDRMELVDYDVGTDGSGGSDLMLPGIARRPPSEMPVLKMNGAKVLMFTMSKVPLSVRKVLDRQHLGLTDVDLFVFHQASRVVLDSLERTLRIPTERLFRNLGEIGNTVSCSIPIALKQLDEAGRLRPGMLILLSGFGVGLSWATCLVRIA